MKTRSCVGGWAVSCTVAFAMLLAGAGPVQANFLYDFEGLAPGGLAGQDGWAVNPGWSDATVAAGSGANATKVAANPGWIAVEGDSRAITPLVFTAADTAVEQHVWVQGRDATGGYRWPGVNPAFMLFGSQGAPATGYFRDAGGTEHFGSALVLGDWYDMKFVMDFSVAGGKGTLYTRNVTAGATAFTQDALLTNIGMGLTSVGGQYTADGLNFRIDSVGGATGYVDNFSDHTIPEPSTLALLATGLMALLAYAWRKRK